MPEYAEVSKHNSNLFCYFIKEMGDGAQFFTDMRKNIQELFENVFFSSGYDFMHQRYNSRFCCPPGF